MSIGSCALGYDYITSKEGCEKAAAALHLPDKTAGKNSHAKYPYGCYYKQSNHHLYWGLAGTKGRDDPNRVSLCTGTEI